MTKIKNYVLDTNPSINDKLIGTDVDSSSATKNFTVQSILELASPSFKSIVAGNNIIVDNEDPLNPVVSSKSGGVFSSTQTSIPVITPSSGEGDLIGSGVGSLIVPANEFRVGDAFVATASGYLNCANNQELEINVYVNDLLLFNQGVFRLSLSTNKVFNIEIKFKVRSIGSSGNAEMLSSLEFSHKEDSGNKTESFYSIVTNNTSFDTTILNALTIKGKWIDTHPSNAIQTQDFVLTKIY